MTPLFEVLADKQLPGWLLVKNAVISGDDGSGHRIASFDEHYFSDSFDELKAKMPKARLADTREAREYASYRYDEAAIKAGSFEFNDLPISLMNEGSDRELFGESWTMFWVVPPNKDEVIKLITDYLTANADGKISSDLIHTCWNERLNRLFFRHNEELEMEELMYLYQDLHEEVIPAINALECAPDEESWEILNEDVFWDDDEN
jgi:hypothetical protein